MKRGIIIFVILLIIGVLSWYIYTQYAILSKAKWKYAGTRVNSLGIQTNVFTVLMTVENPGDLGVVVTEQDYSVFLNNDVVATVKAKQNISINANGVSTVPLMVELQSKDLFKAGINNLVALTSPDKSNALIRLTGTLTLILPINMFGMQIGAMAFRKLPFEQSLTLQDLLTGKAKV